MLEQAPNNLPPMSPIERQILEAVSRGMQSKEIAALLHRSRGTVEGHIRILYAKFGAKSRAHLVAVAFQMGILA